MSDINLLPQELKPSGAIIKLSSTLKKFALLGVVVFFLSLSLFFAASIFLDKRVSDSLSSQENLKKQIKALEKTEQRLVLVKDRLEKIDDINNGPRANDELKRLNIVSDYFPENTAIEEINLSEHNALVSISTDNLDNVAKYLATVISSGQYTKVNLSFLEFDPKVGYAIGLAFPE